MEDKGSAFLKGGTGCLALCAIIACLVLLAGGHVRVNFWGLVFLFFVGGIIGLIAYAAYQKGRADTATGKIPPPGKEASSSATEAPSISEYLDQPTVCVQCGTSIPVGATVCAKCGWTYKDPKTG